MEDSAAIGPYRLLEPLGRGGMGVVYRARHAASERAVALKTVQVPATRWLESIRREIQALTRIRHPGVVRIVDHGVHRGRPWYAMDLLEGESLAHFGERIWSPYRRPSTPRVPPIARAAAGELATVLQIMRRICASLAFLHGEGLVNCDLKPENVLLVQGQPVIIDFGLTAHHPGGSGREALETQRAMSGTLPYMSPEQIRGEFLDARSDLYAVGCMLYELVVGHVPFGGAPLSVKTSHLSAAPVPPSELVSDVPPELERVILKLLEKDLDRRFGYADEVAALLAAMSNDVPRLREFPPPRSYLYRPRFVGRDALVSQLAALRDRAVEGCGALVLLAGESGVGKTRVAMEVTRVLPSSRMHIVTGEASSLSTESAGAVGSSPLHALRPLLQAVADAARRGGPRRPSASSATGARCSPSTSHCWHTCLPTTVYRLRCLSRSRPLASACSNTSPRCSATSRRTVRSCGLSTILAGPTSSRWLSSTP
jgi:eukaryotic-like serine/threonine-protein kinase